MRTIPRAQRITLVSDNLNTHTPASLYEAFAPAEARRLVEKLEIVHTPKHGSWLNVPKVELAALDKQCIGGRVPDRRTLSSRTAAGPATATTPRPKSTGNSPPPTPASSSADSTRR